MLEMIALGSVTRAVESPVQSNHAVRTGTLPTNRRLFVEPSRSSTRRAIVVDTARSFNVDWDHFLMIVNSKRIAVPSDPRRALNRQGAPRFFLFSSRQSKNHTNVARPAISPGTAAYRVDLRVSAVTVISVQCFSCPAVGDVGQFWCSVPITKKDGHAHRDHVNPGECSDFGTRAGYRTIADLLKHLGGVSPARVRFSPWPGTATVRDVVAVHDAENRLCELIDGVLVEKVMGFDESIYAVLLSASIVAFLKTQDLGKVIGADGLMRIFPGMVRIPDTAFISWRRYPKASGDRGKFPWLFPTWSSRSSPRETHRGKWHVSSMSTSVRASAWFGTSIPSGEPFASIPAATTRCFSAKTPCSTAAMSCQAFPCRSVTGSPKRGAPRRGEGHVLLLTSKTPLARLSRSTARQAPSSACR